MSSIKQSFARYARIVVLAMVVLAGGAGLVAYVPVAAGQPVVAATPTVELYAQPQPTLIPTVPGDAAETSTYLDTDPFIRTELFFGSERPHKAEVSKREFKRFLDEVVTPRFPDGLTQLTGFGQFRESNGEIVQETSFVLVLLYPRETAKDSSTKIEEIRKLYIERFEQESVLRVDDPRPVRVSF